MLDRRSFLGSLAAAASLPGMLATGARRAGSSGRTLILVWLDGGMTHLDTFDGKPQAAPDIRGDLKCVKAPLDGVLVSEHLPRLRPLLDRCVLVRSLTHGEGNHDRGAYLWMTGHRPSPVVVHPALGAVVSSERPASGSALPSWVCIPDAPDGASAGFLPAAHAPFEVLGDPARPDFRVRHLTPREGAKHLAELLAEVDRLDGPPRSGAEAARDAFLAQAQALSLDPKARALFDLDDEPAAARERYGAHRLGQSCLLARRLATGGARVVVVRDTGWDHHQDVVKSLTQGFPPKLTAVDQALSALLDDLERSGAAERVTVCLASEFGRTPRLNPSGGRDHWPRAQSVLLFGAGLRRGVVVGATDARGEEPIERPVSPQDLLATLYHLLGVDPSGELRSPQGRPIPLVERGATPIGEALAPS